MNYSLGQIILAVSSSDSEGVFWIQMLVLAILATVVGVYSLVKIRAKHLGNEEEDYAGDIGSGYNQARLQNRALNQVKGKGVGTFSKTARAKAITEEPALDFDARDIERERSRDLHSGMEILEEDFLVSIVEKTKGDDKNDVMMRKLSFNELLRRGQLKSADSNALEVYAKNEGNLYGKDIQCEAMKELAKRTGHRSG